jgi:hypothetical protein
VAKAALFRETATGTPKHENSVSTFHGPDTPECTT